MTEVEEEATHGLRGPVRPRGRRRRGRRPTPRPPRARRWWPRGADREPAGAGRADLIVALLTLLVLGGLAYGAYWLLSGGPSSQVSVPSVLGATRQGAEQELSDAGLRPAFRNVSGPEDDTVGTVIRQTPDRTPRSRPAPR